MQHRLMTAEQRRAKVSPLYCAGCGTHLTKTEQIEFLETAHDICKHCSAGWEHVTAAVLPGSQKFLDVGSIAKNTWYHTTDLANWMSVVLFADPVPMVHIGTRYAALDRGRHSNSPYLFKLRVDPDARIYPLVWEDTNAEWGLDAVDCDYDIYRYINTYESPGSISLLARPSTLTVVEQLSIK